jgi:hypothetical protein
LYYSKKKMVRSALLMLVLFVIRGDNRMDHQVGLIF